MCEKIFTVEFLSFRNSYCYLSTKNKDINKYVFVSNGAVESYFSVNYLASVDENNIGINSRYAKMLGFTENETVTLKTIEHLPTISSFALSTNKRDDYEILELLADNVQSTMLDQIRVLQNGQSIIIWIGTGLHVTATVSEIKPVSPGIIDNLTEVLIKSPNETKHPNKENEAKITSLNDNSFLNFFTQKDMKISLNNYTLKMKQVFRLVPLSQLDFNYDAILNPFNVYLSKEKLKSFNQKIYTLTLLPSELEAKKAIYVNLHPLPVEILGDNLFISKNLQKFLNTEIGARCTLQPYTNSPPEINEIEICTKRSFIQNIEEKFKEYLVKICNNNNSAILNSNVILNITDNLRCYIRFQPVQDFCVIDSDLIRNCKFSVHDEVLPLDEEKSEDFIENSFIITVGNYQKIIDNCLRVVEFGTINGKLENLLIQGKLGSGKTTLIKLIKNNLTKSPYLFYSKIIFCRNIKGKTVESLNKLFLNLFYTLLQHQPSVLFIDDLNILCENINEGDVQAQNTVYFNCVSEMLKMIIEQFRDNKIAIIATCESFSKINKILFSSRGEHIFKNLHTISSFQKNDRGEILKFLFKNNEIKGVDFEYLSQKTDNFVMQDLVDFANRCLYEACIEDCEKPKILLKHCENALKNTSTLALQDIPLHSQINKDFSDIGGLKNVKEIIDETMLGSVKYPNLFANPPIRLPTGFLLYGAPGTGKTLIAGAAAKHCGLRLISIKGPELLSKYIGASEQAVRDVFEKAQSAKPCILFFDEFDSLAPRRGHDNTGVTDRVVNQLLTQLDGVEVLTDVWVLAATSRPDLLDPALLRPGRLDRQILCPLPNKGDRVEILKVLSKSIILAEDVELEELAEKTEGFSGADLKSILYSAQMAALDSLNLNESLEHIEVKVNREQLIQALSKTRPSLSKDDRKKFETIYQRFQGGQLENFIPGSKATLA